MSNRVAPAPGVSPKTEPRASYAISETDLPASQGPSLVHESIAYEDETDGTDDEEVVGNRQRLSVAQRVVSIKNCTLLLLVVSIVGTAAVCVLLGLQSSQSALDKKEDQCNAAIGALGSSSRDSLGTRTDDLLEAVVGSQGHAVLSFLNRNIELAVYLEHRITSFSARGISFTDRDKVIADLQFPFWTTMALSIDKGVTGLGFIENSRGHAVYAYEQPESVSNPPDGIHVVLATHAYGADPPQIKGPRYIGTPIPYHGGLNYSQGCCDGCTLLSGKYEGWAGIDGACKQRFEEDQRRETQHTLSLLPWWQLHKPRWSPPFVIGDLLGIAAIVPCGENQVKMGSMSVGVDVRALSVTYETEVKRLTAGGSEMVARIFSSVASDVFFNDIGPLAQLLNYESQVGVLTGASHGSTTGFEYSPVNPDGTCPPNSRVTSTNASICQGVAFILTVNSSDPVIREMAVSFGSNYSNASSTAQLLDIPREDGAEPEPFYVRSTKVVSPGLEWWVVIAIDRESIMGHIDEQLRQVNEAIVRGAEQVDEEVEDDRNVLLYITAGVMVAFIFFGWLFVSGVTGPLHRLMEEMKFVSEMEIDRVDEERSLSGLREVYTMELSFRTMISNLREFRKYMPATILEDEEEDEYALSDVRPPAAGTVTLVFTDIKGSTSLWENATSAMAVSLKQHNGIIRKALKEHGGYEVKTVGDAFFCVFEDPEKAVRFSVQCQADLNEAEWPQELAESGLPQAAQLKDADTGKYTWNGVRIRIGVHMGHCEMEVNPTTHRADYFGPPVNTAARCEAAGVGGFVVISDAVSDAVGKAKLDTFCTQHPLGEKEMKGVGKPVALTGLLPRGLSKRMDIVGSDGQEKAPVRRSVAVQKAEDEFLQRRERRDKKKVPGKLRTALTVTRGAVAQVISPFLWDDERGGTTGVLEDANRYVAVSEASAERTEGVLQFCIGSAVIVSWGAGRKCGNPQDQSVIFVGILYKRFKDAPRAARCCLGVAGSVLLFGNLGAAQRGARRFATVMGAAVEQSGLLALLARQYLCFALACRLERSLAVRSASRPIVRWTKATETYLALELDLDEEIEPLSTDDAQWTSPAYERAFEGRNVADLLRIAELRTHDRTLTRVAEDAGKSDLMEAWWMSGITVPDRASFRTGAHASSRGLSQASGHSSRRFSGGGGGSRVFGHHGPKSPRTSVVSGSIARRALSADKGSQRSRGSSMSQQSRGVDETQVRLN
eukprot:Hpha_TRINITY_DN16198_c2_g2::TRINITY_DN16198_c2_g2_i5::g.6361::m.6361